jgi:hypothetical protein
MSKVSQETMMFPPVIDKKNVATTIKEVAVGFAGKRL